jgi:hypothetical protein
VRWDLEQFPWPWEDNSVAEVHMSHILEHLGERTEIYLGIVKELYRICMNGAVLRIMVPHPRHDDFLGDPTHVRPIMPDGWNLFSRAKNEDWKQRGCSNSPLGFYLDVDFEVTNVTYVLDGIFSSKVQEARLTQEQISEATRQLNNTVKEIRIEVKAIKPPR